MKTLQIFALSALCFFTNSLFSQTGPGGVGNNATNGLWLKSDNLNLSNDQAISLWKDASGNDNNAIQAIGVSQPNFKEVSTFNGYPSVSFDGINDWLRVEDADILDGTSSINFFTVVKPKGLGISQEVQAIVAKRDTYLSTSENSAYSFFFYFDKLTNDINTNNNRYNTGSAIFNNDVNYLLSFDFDGTLPVASRSTISRDGNVLVTAKETSSQIVNSNNPLTLGQLNVDDNRFFKGEMVEIVHFNYKLNSAEKTIVHNYLSAKFNLEPPLNDFYKQDDVLNGNFDHNVAGIGKATDGSSHTNSQGSGIVRINNPSILGNDSFLFWGEETKNANYDFLTNTNNFTEQLNSKWRVSKRGALGTVDVAFDGLRINLSDFNACKPLELVVANNSNFTSPRVYPLSVSAGVAKTSNVTFNDNDYFTIRYIDKIVWNGTRYFNGSLPNQAPNNTTDKCLKLLVKNGDKARLNQNAYVKDIEVEAGAFLEIADGVELTVENGIINNGTIDLLGEAELIQKHGGLNLNSGNGKLKISQQGTTNLFNYNYWSSPVTRNGAWQIGFLEQDNDPITFNPTQNANPATSPITLSSRWLYTYNASAALGYYGWNRINAGTPIKPGIGYTMKGSGSETLNENYTFSGQANSGNYTYSVEAGNDFLVGNPYASALNADQFIRDNLDVTNGTLYFYEQFESNNTHVTRAYQGGYATFNLLAGVAAVSQLENGGLPSKGAPTKNIAVGQGFYITITENGLLNFTNAQRVFAKESNVGPNGSIFYRQDDTNENSESDTRTKFWLNFTDPSGRSREIVLGYDDNASEGFDRGYDAIDYSEYSDNMVWYTPDNLLVIQGLKTLNLEDEMALSIKVTNPGNYTIGLERTLNFPDSTPIYLKDNQENRFYDLKAETATIAFEAGTFNTRYSIVYQRDTLGVSSLENNSSVYVKFDKNNDTVQLYGIDNLNTVKGVYIYSVDGKQVHYSQRLDSDYINVSSCNDGIYILKLEMLSGAAQNIRFVKY